MMHQDRSNQGFTLIELMVAVAVVGLLSMAIASGLEGQKRFYNSNERVVETQEDARLVLDLLKFETRMAGFMVTPVAAIASADGGAGLPDRYCVSSSTGFDIPDANGPTSLNHKVERYLAGKGSGSNVTAIISPVMIRLTSLDIDGIDDGPITEVNFADQSGIIISDGTTSHCAGIDVNGVDPATNTISLNPNHAMPAAFNAANLRAVPAVVYEIQPGSTNLRRNGALMSSTVEDLQVEFWDTATPLQNPVYDLNDPLNGVSPSTVSRVRLSVVSTSTQVDTGSSKEFGGGQRPAIANRAAGPLDNLQRRVFTATVMPRNISTLP